MVACIGNLYDLLLTIGNEQTPLAWHPAQAEWAVKRTLTSWSVLEMTIPSCPTWLSLITSCYYPSDKCKNLEDDKNCILSGFIQNQFYFFLLI
jgi:hypothetical protein